MHRTLKILFAGVATLSVGAFICHWAIDRARSSTGGFLGIAPASVEPPASAAVVFWGHYPIDALKRLGRP